MKRLVVVFEVDHMTDEQISRLAFDAEVQCEETGDPQDDDYRPDADAFSYVTADPIKVEAIDRDVERHERASLAPVEERSSIYRGIE